MIEHISQDGNFWIKRVSSKGIGYLVHFIPETMFCRKLPERHSALLAGRPQSVDLDGPVFYAHTLCVSVTTSFPVRCRSVRCYNARFLGALFVAIELGALLMSLSPSHAVR